MANDATISYEPPVFAIQFVWIIIINLLKFASLAPAVVVSVSHNHVVAMRVTINVVMHAVAATVVTIIAVVHAVLIHKMFKVVDHAAPTTIRVSIQ